MAIARFSDRSMRYSPVTASISVSLFATTTRPAGNIPAAVAKKLDVLRVPHGREYAMAEALRALRPLDWHIGLD